MRILEKSIESSIADLGIKNVKKIVYNPTYDVLYNAELDSGLEGFEKGYLTELGAVNVMTGKFTGRSPKDKYIVKDDVTKDTLWWNSEKAPNDNKPTTQAIWNDLKGLVIDELSDRKKEADTRLGMVLNETEMRRWLPKHKEAMEIYKQGNIEVIDFILDQDMDYLTASITKYICRWRFKNGLEDLKKARWFLDKLIEHEGGQYGSNFK